MKEETTGLGGRLDPQDEDEGVKDYCKVGGGHTGKGQAENVNVRSSWVGVCKP